MENTGKNRTRRTDQIEQLAEQLSIEPCVASFLLTMVDQQLKDSNAGGAANRGPGEPCLQGIKEWLKKRTFSEKLTAVLLRRLVIVESMYAAPDDSFGCDIAARWEREISDLFTSFGDSETATAEELAISGFTVSLYPVQV